MSVKRKVVQGFVLILIAISLFLIIQFERNGGITGFIIFNQDSESGFENGTYVNTEYGGSSIVLSGNNISGSYTSQVFDAENTAVWNNISWTHGGFYGIELPDNGVSEGGLGGVDMSGNVLLFHMNEGSGTIVDTSGNGNDGTQTGGVTYGASGKFDTALDFDGVDDHLAIPTDSSLSFRDEITIESWIYWSGEVGAEDDLQNIVTNGDWRRSLRITEPDHFQSSKILATFRIGGGPVNNLYSNAQIETNTWYHVATTYDGADLSIYINGQFDSSLSDSGLIQSTSIDTYIGVEETTYFFNGIIDEVAIYNRSLSSQELLDRYNRGALNSDLSARSCDDSSCSGESFVDIDDTSPQDLSLNSNRYFQYNFDFDSDNESVTPELFDVSIDYTEESDVIAPSVFDLIPIANTEFNTLDEIEIAANVTDNVGVDKVFGNITFPNGTIQQLALSNAIGD